MAKEKIPTLKPRKGCVHKLSLPLYARDQGRGVWNSTQNLTGKMIYICIKCGALLDKGFKERDMGDQQ